MTFIIATKNRKKLAELRRILAPLGVDAVCEEETDFQFPEVEETGVTFAENALLKARSVAGISGLPAVADDSGLCVDALDGAPGVYSARYAGAHGDDKANNTLLLQNLAGLPEEKRTAHFVSAVAVVFPDGREFTVEGRCSGRIGFEERGEGGFGYDPLFYVGDKSFAELTAAEKDAISHRGRALAALSDKLKAFKITEA
ncbi:MAG: XTP/dITP diphosphatase [Candidatus Howiella sp.]|jgi:XTP/dITP diphosphohydrolase